MPFDHDTRVGAYGVVVLDGHILLAQWNAAGGSNWTLPGGGLEVGEDPDRAAVREVFEETGYHVRLERLLGIDSEHVDGADRLHDVGRPLHSLRILYLAGIVGGALRREVGGSTDDARWFPLDEVSRLRRVPLVDVGIELLRGTIAVADPPGENVESRKLEDAPGSS